MKTFKQFKYLLESSSEKEIDELIEFAKKHGFIKNLSMLAKSGIFLYRGSNTMSSKISSSDKLFTVSPKQSEQRTSRFSSSRILTNLWHAEENLPSRKTAKFATPNSDSASIFGELVIIIPKDNAELSFTQRDFNESFSQEVHSYFGMSPWRRVTIGNFSAAFIEIVASIIYVCNKTQHSNVADALDAMIRLVKDEHVDAKKVKSMYHALDNALAVIDIESEDVIDLIEKFNTENGTDIIKAIRLLKSNSPSFDYFKTFFNAIRDKLVTQADLSTIIDKIKNVKTSHAEVWWESDSLIIKSSIRNATYLSKLLKALDEVK